MNTRVSQLYGVGMDVEVKRINMRLGMQIQKKNDGLSLRNLANVLRACSGGSDTMDFEQFEMGLRKYK